ncbi:gamma-secretase subunit APH-1A-like isoform X2 [Hemicordylus capensis]|uniref:gamma-secretase subunit APH-1A-like isoform X2 n=1 Tax=Hemicordylus capensis TaxID=884348 RepID=UPI002304A3AE|nr:gamma-secretase subunit APH-1A-like isoform X2 [Hemicordylus capensis]
MPRLVCELEPPPAPAPPEGFLLAGLPAALLAGLVHCGEGQRPERRGPAERAAHLGGHLLGAAAGGLSLPLLQVAQAIEGLVALSEDGCSPISIQQMAYVAGLGFGLMSGAFSMINLLADAVGPGTVGIHGDSPLYFLTSAFMTLVLIFLHTFWGVVFFHGCETRHWWEVAVVVLTHLIISGLTFWNPLYLGSLLPAYLLMAAAAVWAYVVSGGSKQNLSRFLLCLRSGTRPQPAS